MRNPARIETILQALGEVWRLYPDMRLGQLVVIAVRPTLPAPEIFSAEDDRVLAGLKAYAKLKASTHYGERDDEST